MLAALAMWWISEVYSGLTGCPRVRHPPQSIGEWLVVCEDCKPVAVQHIPEVPYTGVTGEQLPVEGGVLCWGTSSFLEKNPRSCQFPAQQLLLKARPY
jgi:hypothetical protein